MRILETALTQEFADTWRHRAMYWFFWMQASACQLHHWLGSRHTRQACNWVALESLLWWINGSIVISDHEFPKLLLCCLIETAYQFLQYASEIVNVLYPFDRWVEAYWPTDRRLYAVVILWVVHTYLHTINSMSKPILYVSQTSIHEVRICIRVCSKAWSQFSDPALINYCWF